MAPVARVNDKDDPRLVPYRSLRAVTDAGGRARTGVFVTDGETVTRALLRSRLTVQGVLCDEAGLERIAAEVRARGLSEEQVLLADRALITRIVGFRLHQGVMGLGERPPPPSLCACAPPAIALDRLEHAENVGAIVRSAAALGVRRVIVDGRSAHPYLRRAVRVSMGTVFDTDVHEVPDLAEALSRLREETDATVVGATLAPGATPLPRFGFGDRFVLVVGNEGEGLDARTERACDALVTIPMRGFDSLNVAAAAAILLYEATREKDASPDGAGPGGQP